MSILNRARHAALTLPQIHTPRVAAAMVRAVTSSGSSSKGKSRGDATSDSPSSRPRAAQVRVATGMSVGDPGERYVPEVPNTGRKSGIVAAQHAAAPGDAAVALSAQLRERVVEFPEDSAESSTVERSGR